MNPGEDVALFIDWENFKISLASGQRLPNVSSLKEEVANHGRVVVAKAYADWVTRAPELRGASQFINDPPALYAAGIEPVYVPTRLALSGNSARTTRVKNSVDVKMTADCIEIAHSYPNIGTYVLVSGARLSARELIEEKDRMREIEAHSLDRHLRRLQGGTVESIETSEIHLETIRALKQINSAFSSIAYPILTESGDLLGSRLAQSE